MITSFGRVGIAFALSSSGNGNHAFPSLERASASDAPYELKESMRNKNMTTHQTSKFTAMKSAAILSAVLALCLSLLAVAQTATVVRRAELAVPFGTAAGKLVLVGDYLTFVDEERPDSSFTITRGEMRNFKTEGDQLMIETQRAVRDRSGERTHFAFKLMEGTSDPFAVWAAAKTTMATTAPSDIKSSEGESWTFNAKHSHSVARVPSGSCTGKLIITRDRVVYESLEDREHTRQWPLIDIKKTKRSNPYKFEIEPFNRDKYTLELEGSGMDISVFKKLQNWIVQARVKS